MNLVQLSLFSQEFPDKEIVDKKSKQKVTSPLPHIQDIQEKKQEIHNNENINNLEEKIVVNDEKNDIEIKNKLIIEINEKESEKMKELTDKERLLELEKLKNECLECQKCELAKTRTNVVFGSGNPLAYIMLIGEGPGQNEDEQGIPFIGRAGQLLTKILEAVEIDREKDVFITNVVKCRPPENRVPTQDEVKACFGYLEKQIELSGAKIILLTGATALKAILNYTAGISKVRGEWMNWNDKLVMPIFHPSYLLRNPSKQTGSPKWYMWQDMKKIKEKLDELKALDQKK